MQTAYPEDTTKLDDGMIRCEPEYCSNGCTMFFASAYDDMINNSSLSPFDDKISEVVLDARSSEGYAFIQTLL